MGVDILSRSGRMNKKNIENGMWVDKKAQKWRSRELKV
jgi:hypothetical protein